MASQGQGISTRSGWTRLARGKREEPGRTHKPGLLTWRGRSRRGTYRGRSKRPRYVLPGLLLHCGRPSQVTDDCRCGGGCRRGERRGALDLLPGSFVGHSSLQKVPWWGCGAPLWVQVVAARLGLAAGPTARSFVVVSPAVGEETLEAAIADAARACRSLLLNSPVMAVVISKGRGCSGRRLRRRRRRARSEPGMGWLVRTNAWHQGRLATAFAATRARWRL